MAPGRRLTIDYLVIQALAGIAWWVALLVNEDFRARFRPEGFPPDFILTYLIPDAALFIGGSLLAALLVWRRHALARVCLGATAGATIYAFMHCVGIAVNHSGFLAAVLMMAPAACFTTALALTLGPDPDELPRMPFKVASEQPTSSIWRLTVLQTTVFWMLFLVIAPGAIVWSQSLLGISHSATNSTRIAGVIIFIAGGSLGVWSSRTMTVRGRGTPLPSAAARRLVTSGPYRFIRNPMAVGGLLQGMGVALILGSWFVAAYVVIGAFLWNHTVRPAEEADLLERFGREFGEYTRRVRCWLPMPRRHAALPPGDPGA